MAFGALLGSLSGNGLSVVNPSTATGSVVVHVGDLVYVVFQEQTSVTATSASDNLGNTYNPVDAGIDSGGYTARCFYSVVSVAGTLTTVEVVATPSANNYIVLVSVNEGPFAPSPLDANPTEIIDDLTSPFTCPATGTLAQADEVVFGWGLANGSAAWTATAPNIEVVEAASASVFSGVLGYQVVTATTSVAPAFTRTAPANSLLGTASFKKATATSGSMAKTESWGPDDATMAGGPVVRGTMARTESLGSDDATMAGGPVVAGSMAKTEVGADDATAAGTVAVRGTMAKIETGADDATMAGGPIVRGAMARTETGADDATMAGGPVVRGTMARAETGADDATMSGSVGTPPAFGAMTAAEGFGPDDATMVGATGIGGAMVAQEAGHDVFYADNQLFGSVDAIEVYSDVVEIAGYLLALNPTGFDYLNRSSGHAVAWAQPRKGFLPATAASIDPRGVRYYDAIAVALEFDGQPYVSSFVASPGENAVTALANIAEDMAGISDDLNVFSDWATIYAQVMPGHTLEGLQITSSPRSFEVTPAPLRFSHPSDAGLVGAILRLELIRDGLALTYEVVGSGSEMADLEAMARRINQTVHLIASMTPDSFIVAASAGHTLSAGSLQYGLAVVRITGSMAVVETGVDDATMAGTVPPPIAGPLIVGLYGDSFPQRSQDITGTPNSLDAGQIAPGTKKWGTNLTTRVGGVTWGFGSWLDARSNGKFTVPWQANRGVGGLNTGQLAQDGISADWLGEYEDFLIANAASLLASDCVIYQAGTNDKDGAFTAAQSYANILAACVKITGRGLPVFISTILPRGNSAFSSARCTAPQLAVVDAINTMLLANLEAEPTVNGLVRVIDPRSSFVDSGGLTGDVLATLTYDGLHPSPAGCRVLADAYLAEMNAYFNVAPMLTSGTSFIANGLMSGTGGTVQISGSGATNTGFSITGVAPTGWTVMPATLGVTAWNGTVPANTTGTVVVAQEAAAVGNAIKITVDADGTGHTNANTRAIEAKCAVTLTGAVAVGDYYRGYAVVSLASHAGCRGVSAELRVTEPDAIQRVSRSLGCAPNGTANMTLDATNYTRLVLVTPPMIRKAGTYGAIEFAVMLYFAGQTADMLATLKISEAGVYKVS